MKQGETTVTATYKEGSLDNNAAVFVISETNLPEGIYEVTSTNFEIPANITTLYNISAPEVKSVNVKTGAKDLVLTLSEKVKATAEGSISVEVRKDDTLIDVGTPVLSEDGLTITIPSKDGSIFADAKYDVKLSGISDMAGLSIADKNTASVTKKTAADKIEITSIGVAPAANQTIAYKLTDNYGIEYTDATALASGKITSAAATLTVSGLPIEVAITGDKTATFNATGLAKDTEIEVSITYTAGDVTKTATTKLKVGDAAASASIKNITISNAQGETDPENNGFILGKLTQFDLTANLLDQYGNASTDDNIVTWSISDNSVIAFNGINAAKTVVNAAPKTQTFDVKAQGTAIVTAYLANGAKTEYKVTITLAGLKSIAATNVTGAVNFEDKEVTTGFTFTDINDQLNTLKPLAKDVTFAFKSGDKLTANDIVLTTLANEDGTFKGLKVNAKKSGTYTITMTYADKTADFTVMSEADTAVVKLADIADFTTKTGAAEVKFDVKAINKHDEVLPVQAQNLLLTWFNSTGSKVDDISSAITVKYYDIDGNEITTPASSTTAVAKVGVTFKGTDPTTYTLKAEVKDTVAMDTAKVNCSVATLKSVQIAKGIVADDKFIVNDTAKQYVDVVLKDTDDAVMMDMSGLSVIIKDANDNLGKAFATLKYKHLAQDGTATYDVTKDGAVGIVLELTPNTTDLAAGTYSVWVENADKTIKSNVVNMVVREARALDKVTIANTDIVVTLGSTANVVITPVDQYGDVIAIPKNGEAFQITLDGTPTTVALGTVTEKKDGDKLVGYTLPLIGNAKGSEQITVKVKFSETITKTIDLNAAVKAAGDVVALKFGDDADNDGVLDTKLHDTVMGDTDTYNTVALNLTGLDADGNSIIVKASDFTWDTSELPAMITFDEANSTFSVKADTIDENHTATGKVTAYQAGKAVGNITITFTDAEPTLVSLDFAEADKVKDITEVDLDLNTITLLAKDNFGGEANPAIKASTITNWKSSDTSVATYVAGSIKVTDGAKVGDTAIFTGSYQGKIVTFTVKITDKGLAQGVAYKINNNANLIGKVSATAENTTITANILESTASVDSLVSMDAILSMGLTPTSIVVNGKTCSTADAIKEALDLNGKDYTQATLGDLQVNGNTIVINSNGATLTLVVPKV